MSKIPANVEGANSAFFGHRAIIWIGRLTFWLFITGLSIFLLAFVALLIAVSDASQKMPSFKEIQNSPAAQTIRYHSNNGQIIYISGPAYGEWIEYDKIPASMKNAIISIEDKRYYNHIGVDPVAIARVIQFAFNNRGKKRRLQGASTITQQTSRNLFLNRKYEVQRKIKEIVMALAMEQKFTKQQILEIYLNKIYLGGGTYGIDAASRTFFGHGAVKLNNAEAAILAGAAKAPSEYSPTSSTKNAVGRSKIVLLKMLENKRISKANYKLALSSPPKFYKAKNEPRDSTRYFLDWIQPQVKRLAPRNVRNIDVYTTLDLKAQKLAENSLEKNAGKNIQGSVITIQNNGAVRAMIGGRSYTNSNYNRATQSLRQPGSAFKPFVYMAALENGYTPSSIVIDAPITIKGWSPQNNSRRYSGTITMENAFAWSLNTVAVRIGKNIGFDRIGNMAQRFGVTTPITVTPSIALGTSEVRIIEIARAYSIISNQGKDVLPYGIEEITVNKQIVYKNPKLSPHSIVRPLVAARITQMMMGTVEKGTGTGAQIGKPVAGKTGTTTSGKDGWFIGFSSGYTTAVWIGRDDAKPIPNLQGGRAPASVFSNYMRVMLKDKPSLPMIISKGDDKDLFGKIIKNQNAIKSKSNKNVKKLVNEYEDNKTEKDSKIEPNRSNQGKSRIIPME